MSGNDLIEAQRALEAGDAGRGERLLRRQLARSPNDARANELMAFVLAQRGDWEGSLECLKRATRASTATGAAWYHLGVALANQGDRREARKAFETAIQRDAAFFPAHHDLGVVSYDEGDFEASLAAFDRAVALEPQSFEVHHNRGRALSALGRHEDALASYDRCIVLGGTNPATHLNRGQVLTTLRRYPEALDAFRFATQLQPTYDDARWNESLTRLLLGQFEDGWELYECRWSGSMAWSRRHTGIPALRSVADAAGKRVLVWWEQGFGDTLHFCRYLPMLAEHAGQVVFDVQPTLARLIRSLDPRIEVVSGNIPAGCDFQVPLLSLPRLFGTRMDNIPSKVPYLAADRGAIDAWRTRLATKRRPIGVVCAGHASQKDNRTRSMALRDFAPLLDLGDLYVVQVDVAEADRSFARTQAGRIHLLDESIHDFMDSAAILECMDAVVTIDSAVAHLAGALAKPTWILLPWTPTWRWLTDREDSPWYPTARLVRQRERGRWNDVVDRVARQLGS